MDTDHTTRPRPRSTPPSSGCSGEGSSCKTPVRTSGTPSTPSTQGFRPPPCGPPVASAAACSEQRDERDRWYEAEAAATNEIISVGIKQMGAIADLYGEDDDLDFGFWPTRLRSSTAGTATTATPLPVPTSKKAAVGMELLAEAWTEHDDRLTDVRTRE